MSGFVAHNLSGSRLRLRRVDQPGGVWSCWDDSTSEVYAGFFVTGERRWASLRSVRETVEVKGLFDSLDADHCASAGYVRIRLTSGNVVTKITVIRIAEATQ